jgi:alpha-beta hydrolase superfamily lysophospholipase
MKKILSTLLAIVLAFALLAPRALLAQTNAGSLHFEPDFLAITNSNGSFVKIHYNRWYQNNARGVIVEMAGLQSHSMWFSQMGEQFYKAGYNVYSFDRRGSGQSTGARGDIENYQVWIDDLERVVATAKRENPGLPVHLLANCFGTRIALGFAIQHPEMVNSLMLTAPATHMRVDLAGSQKASAMAFATAPIATPLTDKMFTTNPEFLAYMKNDTLALRKATGRLFRESLSLNEFVLANLNSIQLPVLTLLSQADEVIRAKRVIREFHQKLPNPNNKLVVYNNAAHFLLFENVWNDTLNNMLAWVGRF